MPIRCLPLVAALALVLLIASAAVAAPKPGLSITESHYLADTPFPQFAGLWQEGWSFRDPDTNPLIYLGPDMPLGGYMHLFVRNTGTQAFSIADFTINGIKLSQGLEQTHYPKSADERFQASILLSKLPKAQIDVLRDAGHPMWWKSDPPTVEPGVVAEVVLRLRKDPKSPTLKLGVIADSGQSVETTVAVKRAVPRFATIAFSPDLTEVNLYTRHPKGAGMKPTKLFIDDTDITKHARIAADRSLDLVSISVKLPEPPKWMSHHVFRAVYADRSAATASIRAWGRDMVYAMWGSAGDIGPSEEHCRKTILDWNKHNLNGAMGIYPGDNSKFFVSDEGWKFTEGLGMGRMTHWIQEGQTPMFLFLMDEPDACDAATEQVPAGDRLGTNGMWLSKWNAIIRKYAPDTPTLLNIDGTFKPENYYAYHQLSDIPCIDPYYQGELDLVYEKHPENLPAYTKPTYVYATSAVSQSSGQPKPLHVILCSTKYVPGKPGPYLGRYPTPEEKRMEAYYAIAAGAKGLSYWWFSRDGNCRGCGYDDDPAAGALYKEIGLIGAEMRTGGPVITMSCPIDLPIKGPRRLWARTLISGQDTVALIGVNDNVLCDRVGTVHTVLPNAKVSIGMPSWISPKDAFEITYSGIKDVDWKTDAGKVAIDLGDVDLSRFIIITADAGLRAKLSKLYEEKFAANVATLVKE